MDDFITVKQAAAILNVSGQRVRQLLANGQLRGKHFANAWMVETDSVKERKRRLEPGT
jgi:excisionase family DNA binding protein